MNQEIVSLKCSLPKLCEQSVEKHFGCDKEAIPLVSMGPDPSIVFGCCANFEFDQGYRNSLIKAMVYSCILLPCLWCRAKYKQLQYVVE